MKSISKVKIIISVIFLFIISFTLSYKSDINIPGIYLHTFNDNSVYTQNTEKKLKEVTLVYLGSSSCKYSDIIEIEGINEVQNWLLSKSIENNMSYTSIGISIDWSIFNGIRHLDKVGNFDEIITGNNWFNRGVLKYVGDLDMETSTPQIFIILSEFYSNNLDRKLISEKPVLVLRGSNEIMKWLEDPSFNFNLQ